ncbi:hypothetical protein ACQE98_11935 [Ornithinimicrobium sp. W1679]|uniref:hypothetical protein n=1 Tax=Ornithinimicrobium sp. W1679 TaxID=3418770 RepID=UPI003CE7932F
MWIDVLGVVWSVSNTHLPASFLVSGGTGVRANVLRHIIDGEYTVADMHALVGGLSSDLAEEKLTQAQQRIFFATSMVAAAVGGYATAGASTMPLTAATEWAYGKLTNVDDWIERLAIRWILTSTLMEHDPTRGLAAAEKLRDEATRLSRSGPNAADARHIRLLMAAYRSFAAETVETVIPEMPLLVGMRLSDALELMNLLGRGDTLLLDAYESAENARSPLIKSRWLVKGQRPDPGERVTTTTLVALAYAKPGEYLPHGMIASRLHAL